MTDERAIAFLRELARADEAAAATLRELDELEAEARRIGERALALDARLRELPAAHESARRARGEAQGELVRRREAHE
ncbi:MAG: hypothetical protein M3327_02085, partial [Actinomycetota bacterium]|nr:hypothetical protein [Actinomycetota bacterium]